MSALHYIYDEQSCGLSNNVLAPIAQQASFSNKELSQVVKQQSYQTPYASLVLPFDTSMHKLIAQITSRISQHNPTMILVIGIGGSNLGAFALIQALFGLLHNETSQPRIYWADTLDSMYANQLLTIVMREYEQSGSIVLLIISKSGTTLETISHAHVWCTLLQSLYGPTYAKRIMIITDSGSSLSAVAGQQGYHLCTIPVQVGGRYSVLSCVGIIPALLMGIDVDALWAGARDVISMSVQKNDTTNNALWSAAIVYAYYQQGISIHDLFLYGSHLEGLGKWYRQLVAESLGKQSAHGAVGITPTVTIGTTDLHSMLQLYLAGPSNRFTTFVTIEHSWQTVQIPCFEPLRSLVALPNNLSFNQLMNVIATAVCKTYQNQQRPFMHIIFNKLDAYTIGQFLQYNMLQVMYLASLFQVNAFDQPAVELYKQEVRKILIHE